MTQEEQKQALLDSIKSQVEGEFSKRSFATKEAMESAIKDSMKTIEGLDLEGLRAIGKTNDGLVESIRTMGIEITELKKQRDSKPEDLSIRAQVKAWQEANKEAIEGLRTRQLGTAPQLTPLELRDPETMSIANSLNGSAYLPRPVVMPGIVDLVRKQPTFWDRLYKSTINANPLVWVNKTNKEGAAAFIGEGVLKPLASFDLNTQTSTPKKVAERMKVSTELLYDLDYIATEMEKEIRFEVETAANTAVLTGVASSTNPAGITTIASPFSLTSVSTLNPTNVDAIRAAIAQIRSLNFNGTLTAYMNPIDIANMDMEKASDSGVYMLPPFTSSDNTVVKGVRIIEDNNIAVGYLLIGDMDLYRIAMHQPFHIKWGWENDDFSRNLVTVIGEMRFHQWYSSNHVGAWVYDTFANIKLAITAPIV